MAPKHLLHELLQEDQEPFLLKNYIADRRCQLERTTHSTTFTTTGTSTTTTSRLLQVKKRKQQLPTQRNSSVSQQQPEQPQKLQKDSCFFTFNNTTTSPIDPKNSPLFHFSNSALKAPCNSNSNCNNCKNRQNGRVVVLHVPARTAALLLEAAIRIQKPKQGSKGNNGLNVFGSLLKKLTHKSSSSSKKSGQITEDGINVIDGYNDNCMDTLRRCTSCRSSRHSNEERQEEDVGFRFVLPRSPFCSSSSSSSGHHTPEFSSPVASPTCCRIEDKEDNCDGDGLINKQQQKPEELEQRGAEEDKEQCSPVSVLDPPFVDEFDIEEDDHGDEDGPIEDEGFDMECSYAIVERAKQQLLEKLRRFEKLAELDPVELEKRMLEHKKEEDEFDDDDDDDNEYGDREGSTNKLGVEEPGKSRKILTDIKRLGSDRNSEEETRGLTFAVNNREAMLKRARNRIESCGYVDLNTIEMIVERDLNARVDQWTKNEEEVHDTYLEIEIRIFGLLVEELAQELVDFN